MQLFQTVQRLTDVLLETLSLQDLESLAHLSQCASGPKDDVLLTQTMQHFLTAVVASKRVTDQFDLVAQAIEHRRLDQAVLILDAIQEPGYVDLKKFHYQAIALAYQKMGNHQQSQRLTTQAGNL
ncbi:MAG: hypothetical protein JSS62_03785 [Verrucomicrobia bacterium]|nr:hypothetical protein [Verrucomicrobiota bacterium]MBS0645119.1 hypothetical protein [Verrucomicrobiota bacterium]